MLSQDVERINQAVKENGIYSLNDQDYGTLLRMNADILPRITEEFVEPKTGRVETKVRLDLSLPRDEAEELLKQHGRI